MSTVGSTAPVVGRLNLRRTRRLRVQQQAKIVYDSETMIHCEVRDISVGGARIAIKQHVPLPERFELFICAHDLRVHSVKVRWRQGDFVGVSFGADAADDQSMVLLPPHQIAAQSYPALAMSNSLMQASRDDNRLPALPGERVSITNPRLARTSIQAGPYGWERRRLRSRRNVV
jgi:hypothetical protein